MSREIFKDDKHSKLVIDKQEAVGGNGGYLFDSGCNLFGLRKLHIKCGPFDWNNKNYASTIKRIYLEFERPTHSEQGKYQSPSYLTYGVYGDSSSNTFEIDKDDSLVRIDVWASDDLVNALQFRMKSGLVSELYGTPYIYGSKLTSFEGKHPDSKLVGVHGRFGGVIDKLGFTFAAVVPDDSGFPPFPVNFGGTKSNIGFSPSPGDVVDVRSTASSSVGTMADEEKKGNRDRIVKESIQYWVSSLPSELVDVKSTVSSSVGTMTDEVEDASWNAIGL